MTRRKTSVYVDKMLWERFKRHAVMRGMDVSKLLEEIIRDGLMDYLEEELYRLAGSEDYQLDFEPVETKGPVSELVREMRDEKSNNIFR